MQFDGTVQKITPPADDTGLHSVVLGVDETDANHPGTVTVKTGDPSKFSEGQKVALIFHAGMAAAGAAFNSAVQVLQSDEHKLVVAMGDNHQAIELKGKLDELDAKQPGVRLTVFSGDQEAAIAAAPENPFRRTEAPAAPAPVA